MAQEKTRINNGELGGNIIQLNNLHKVIILIQLHNNSEILYYRDTVDILMDSAGLQPNVL